MANEFAEDVLEMQVLTSEYVRELTEIWTFLFNKDMCKSNLNKLKEYARSLYKDLITESLERRQDIEEEINNIKNEAEKLTDLLKVEFKFPCIEEANTPLIVIQSKMDTSLQDLRDMVRHRKAQVSELLLEQENLCEELGQVPKPLIAEPLPSAEEIEEFQEYIFNLKDEKLKRVQIISKLKREINDFLEILQTSANHQEDRLLTSRETKLDKDTIKALELIHTHYASEVENMKEKIDMIRGKLDTLWNLLNVSPSSRKKVQKHSEYNLRTYEVVNGELKRLEELKMQNIQRFVEQIRNEIRDLWEKTLKSDAEKQRFFNFNNNYYTDDLLDLHEMELEELKIHYESNKRIYDLFEERMVLWERMVALEAKASEPGRYKNRGGQLLKEEKERKTIAIKLPKIENEISKLVREYEKEEQKPFLVYGENILEVIALEWEEKRQQKEQITSARKHAHSPSNTKMSTTMVKKTPISPKPTMTTTKTPMTGSTFKKNSPCAKKSLMNTLKSPSVCSRQKIGGLTASGRKARASSDAVFNAPFKRRSGVIGTTIRRHLYGARKRKSLSNSGGKVKVPKIVVQPDTDDGGSESSDSNACGYTYDSFKNCNDPHSRSSSVISSGVIYTEKKNNNNNTTTINKNDNEILCHLSNKKELNSKSENEEEPSCWNRLPDPRNRKSHSPCMTLSTSRRKATKHLPLLY